MADGLRQLDGMIRRLDTLGGMADRVAPRVGEALRREAESASAGQRSPDGAPWPPKKTGGPALVNAGRKASTTIVGTTVTVSLEGPEALHNDGRARGGVRRRILPTRVPVAVSSIVVDEWRRTIGGGL
jgi:hypothetical protein